jgi:hypothetical protein
MIHDLVNSKSSVLIGDIIFGITGVIATTLIRVKGQFLGIHFNYEKLDFILTHFMRLLSTALFAILIYRKHILEMQILKKNNFNNLKENTMTAETNNNTGAESPLKDFVIQALISSLFTIVLGALKHLSQALVSSNDPKKEAVGEILTLVENLAESHSAQTLAFGHSIGLDAAAPVSAPAPVAVEAPVSAPIASPEASPAPLTPVVPVSAPSTNSTPVNPDRYLISQSTDGADLWNVLDSKGEGVRDISGVEEAIAKQKELNNE